MNTKPTPSVLPPLPEPAGFALVQGFGGTEDRLLSSTYDPDSAAYSANHMNAHYAKGYADALAAWQPIETAPTDGTVYLATDGESIRDENCPDGHYPGLWDWSKSRQQWRGSAHGDSFEAAYWMKRPSLPAITAKDAKL